MQGLIKISKYAGMREDLVQAGGGNSSFKISQKEMVIKASGYQLTDITEKEGYAVVRPDLIYDAFLNSENLDSMTEEKGTAILQKAFIKGKRPSIETFLHAISGKYTLHTHPVVVNAIACRNDGMETLRKLFPNALMIPYATPGIRLAKEFFKECRSSINSTGMISDMVFLKNHGLVVSADTAEGVIAKTEKIVTILERYLSCDMREYHYVTELWNYFTDKIIWKVTDIHVLHAYEQLGEMWNSSFCPDCIVFLGKKLLKLPETVTQKMIVEYCAAYDSPVIIEFHNTLYIVADTIRKVFEIQSILSFSAQVALLNKTANCDFLSEKEQDFLLNWDSEKYRKSVKQE